jgi:SAM-dependent methyltransferase
MTSDVDYFLDKVYTAKSLGDLEGAYHEWADRYDTDMLSTGYLHIPVIIGLVTRHVPRTDAAILDAGVGTGQVGAILSILGYNNLNGLDMSQAMLAKAEARKCYAELKHGVLGEKLDYSDKSFDAIISTGTFTTGHAPASAFDELVRILEPGGILMATFGTIVWEEQGFKSKLDELVAMRVLKSVEITPIYCPMPYSNTESGFTTRAHVYRKI